VAKALVVAVVAALAVEKQSMVLVEAKARSSQRVIQVDDAEKELHLDSKELLIVVVTMLRLEMKMHFEEIGKNS
jgi:hypothetical protein